MPATVGTIPKVVRKDKHGVLRVGDTRVILDLVVHAFNEGMTAAEIQYNYDSLTLADVYAAIGYYLHNKAEVDEYIIRREVESDQWWQKHHAKFPPKITREMLLARKNGKDPNWPPK